MKRILFTASAISALTFGCGHSLMQPADSTSAKAGADEASETQDQAKGAGRSSSERGDQQSSAATPRQEGDFIVYRFSGSYRAKPVTVTHRVVARKGTTLVMDVTLADGAKPQQFRVRIKDAPNQSGEILSVARVVGGAEKPFGTAAYEELMAKTMMNIDANEAVVDREVATVRIGSSALPCKKTSYRVIAGGRTATMTIFESPAFAWGDLGGEILSAEGQVLYKASVVEMGGPSSKPAGAIAQTELEDIDDWDDLDLDD